MKELEIIRGDIVVSKSYQTFTTKKEYSVFNLKNYLVKDTIKKEIIIIFGLKIILEYLML